MYFSEMKEFLPGFSKLGVKSSGNQGITRIDKVSKPDPGKIEHV